MEIVFIPVVGSEAELAQAAILSSVTDHSPESQAIFAKSLELTRGIQLPKESRLIEAVQPGALCGVDLKNRKIRKGTRPEVEEWLIETGRTSMAEIRKLVSEIENRGNQAVVIADQESELGVIEVTK